MPRPIIDDDRMIRLKGPGVEDLPVMITRLQDGSPVVISCWMFNSLDIEHILDTKRVWLVTLGTTVAPMRMQSVKPYGAAVSARPLPPCDYTDSQREVWE